MRLFSPIPSLLRQRIWLKRIPSQFQRHCSSSTANQVIKCRAAVAWEVKKPLTIETVEVAPPKKGEVRIKMKNSSICRTDEYTLSGAGRKWPVILGHEGAGVVESVGDGVTTLQPGDHVVPVYVPQCGECVFCNHEKTGLCQENKESMRAGTQPDGTIRFKCQGKEVYHYMGISSFSEYTVASAIQVAKVNKSAPLNKVCVIGCGVTTGYGAVVNTAKVKPGSSVAIWGLGALGMSAIMGAKASGASTIVAVDPNESKFDQARAFGATHCINPKKLPPKTKIQSYLVKEFKGGFDYTFECVGKAEAMREAFESCHQGWGECCVTGVAAHNDLIEIIPFQLLSGRTLKGSIFGNYHSLSAITNLTEEYMSGKLKLDEFITGEYELEDINKAFEELRSGKCLRNVIRMAKD